MLKPIAFVLTSTLLMSCASHDRAMTNQPTDPSAPVHSTADTRTLAALLEDFHDAASKADGPRYFGHFAPGGVFLGTDDSERWSVEQFRAYAEPYFSKGQGWTYTSVSRSVVVWAGGQTAWFDEKLDNAKYGRCRGTGVLVRSGPADDRFGGWRIAQYNLTVPIPNDLLDDVARQIRAIQAR